MTSAVVVLAAWWLARAAIAEGPPTKTLDALLRERLQPVVREWVTAEAQKLARAPSPQEMAVRADIPVAIPTADSFRGGRGPAGVSGRFRDGPGG